MRREEEVAEIMNPFKNNKKQRINKDESNVVQVFATIGENLSYIKEAFYESSDIKTREIMINDKHGLIIYLETMADSEKIQNSVLVPIGTATSRQKVEDIITSSELIKTRSLNEAVTALLKGMSVLFVEKQGAIFLFNTIKLVRRSPDEPENEKVVRGSHEGFVESLDVNLNLVRKRIKNRQLKIQYYEVGWETNTKLAIIYMNEIANPALVKEVNRRIESISSDMAFSPGFVEEFIEDSPFSPFQQILYTERPDRVEAHLMEGRVALITEGSADVSIFPVTLFAFFQSPDDYNSRIYAGSFFRLIRFLSFFGAMTLPALYIAVVGFHFEIIPSGVIPIVKASIENVPFPPFFEALIMALTIELIREAGIRLPTSIGQTIGIVGGLIIGEAVVNAGLISNFMVIIIAVMAIASFTIPSYEMSNSVRILTFPLMIAAATLGFVGVVFALMFIVIHLCKLESFGTPYLAPLAPLHVKDLKDTFIRFPNWKLNRRPRDLKPQKSLKQKPTRGWKKNEE
ncbi:spore germination protein [Bacillus sp. FSL K6-3431]|uniref:spore germination protein n=1 Tax=Bacillus sp. FSL K6-3431 TaxID=2921500 RepID=UPI0030FC4CB7